MNKYYKTLSNILKKGKIQSNKKGNIKYLINEVLSLDKKDLLKIFKEHKIAKNKLQKEIDLYFKGITEVKKYNEAGIFWWDYCAPTLINSYPSYFKKTASPYRKNKQRKKAIKKLHFIYRRNRDKDKSITLP